MSLGNEAREYVAGLTGGELDAMLDRQLSVRLRHAAEVERDKRTCRDCALVGYHCGACDCCTEDDQSDATPSAENDAPCISIWGHYDSHRLGNRSHYCSRCGYVIPPEVTDA